MHISVPWRRPKASLFAIFLLLARGAVAILEKDEVGADINPDAIGRVHFQAPRLDTPFPGSWNNTAENPWTLELNLTREGKKWPGGPETDARFPVFTLQVIPPAPGSDGAVLYPNGSWMLTDVNTSTNDPQPYGLWQMTMGTMDLQEMIEVPDGNDKEHGTCPQSILSKDCIKSIRSKPEGFINDRGILEWRNVTKLPGCEGMRMPQNDEQILFYRKWSIGIDEGQVSYFSRALGQRWTAKPEDFDRYGLMTFPVILVFESGLANPNISLPEENIVIACVKIDTSVNGAALPTGKSAGNSAFQARGWAGIGFAVATGLLLIA